MGGWNPAQYLKFADERTQPCRDLVVRISVDRVHRVVDLGCGPGNSTEVLASRWPNAEITGLDSSAEMMAAARQAYPNHRWILGDIAAWADAETRHFDVVFSNAALQWVPDHAAVYPKLLARTTATGALAVQIPSNFDAPAHRLMWKMASSPAWRGLFPADGVRAWHAHDLTFYYDQLAPRCAHVDLWETESVHVLADADAIVEWYKGSGLRPFLDALDTEAARQRFLAEYLDGIRALYPPRADRRVLLPFRRMFLIAYR